MRAEIPQVTALSGVQGVPGDLTGPGALPVLPALTGLLPAGLPRGSVIATGAWGLLCLALAAAASGAGAWCAVAGLPALGVAAAAGPASTRTGCCSCPTPAPAGRTWLPPCSTAAT